LVAYKTDWATTQTGNEFQAGVYLPMLEDFYQYADYTALFDQYRVLKITYHILPSISAFAVNPDIANGWNCLVARPLCVLAPDYDDGNACATTTAGFETLVMKPGHKVFSLVGDEQVYSMVPRVRFEVDTVTALSTVPANTEWISTNSTDLPFFGLKYWFRHYASTAAAGIVAQVWIIMDVEFRGQHAHLPGARQVPAVVAASTPNLIAVPDGFVLVKK